MMSKSFFKIFLFSILLVLTSCLPTNTNQRQALVDDEVIGGDSTEDTTTTTTSPFADSKDLFWYTTEEMEGVLTLNYSEKIVLYLRGNQVHNFLSQSSEVRQQDYCLAISYYNGNTSTSKVLRTRAVAQTVNSFTFKTTSVEYLFKIDLSDSENHKQNCNGQLNLINLAGRTVTTTSNAAYTLEEVCPECATNITSSNISLYTTNANNSETLDSLTSINQVPLSQIDLRSIQLRIDYTPNDVYETNQCSKSTCIALGFDCCLEGQCINDKTLRTETKAAYDCLENTEKNPLDYSLCLPTKDASSHNNINIIYGQAYSEYKTNLNSVLKYPNFYYLCPSTVVGSSQSETNIIENPDELAQQYLDELIADYYCLEEGKKEQPNYGIEQRCAPGFDQESHDAIALEVWKKCGCDADPFPTQTDDSRCPNYSLKAEFNSDGSIKNVTCDIPENMAEEAPFQVLNLSVSTRSAPHRFFDSAGKVFDDLSAAKDDAADKNQEGKDFSYIDNLSKAGPSQGTYSMNAILGRMTLDLKNAFPAKTVKVEFGQTYIVTALSGYYTPCPQCVEDSWLASFKSFPPSTGGLGVQASGAITDRMNFDENIGLGNYEDTIFGRACWLPPTMIPWTHKADNDLQTQRLNRLAAQSALYVNGYQRDWYGFNQGALIGSFDGVSWFAIGKGRRVNATSSRLFLAINAPFADLAEPSDIAVSIVQDQGGSSAADFDFDTDLTLSDSRQNLGASCQYQHQCATDSDCVSKLGWEYVCSDVDLMKTFWPKFDSEGNEVVNQEYSDNGFAQILTGFQPTNGFKRCVYRGAGAPCKRDYTTLDSNLADLQEQFRCAPNFYCQELTANKFNSKLVRSPDQLNNIFYGQEADVMGRPQDYIGASERLDDAIIENLQHNFEAVAKDVNDFGICRPGKSLSSTDPITTHSNADNFQRTDFINQIASCDSTATGVNRTAGCPIFDDDPDSDTFGDYIIEHNSFTKNKQNMCGAESQFLKSGEYESVFKDIESAAVNSLYSLVTPSLVADACFRRSGSFCHTDLDCSPNSLHADQAILFNRDRFGNTDAELQFWQENLVCGQANEKPLIQDEDFLTFDITKNRCCREVGKEITMYTQSNELTLNPDLGSTNANLDVGKFPHLDPTADNRYSRYVAAGAFDNTTGPTTTPYAQLPIINIYETPKLFQWKTFDDTAGKTCCGGGWIRKFADGTHDWTKKGRLNLSVNNFKCLNYTNELALEKPFEVASKNYEFDFALMCKETNFGGCIQPDFPSADGTEILRPSNPTFSYLVMDTTPKEPLQSCFSTFDLTSDIPYLPVPVALPTDLDPQCSNPRNYFHSEFTNYAISFHLPSYIGHLGNIISGGAKIVYVSSEGEEITRNLKSLSGSTTSIDECPNTNFNPTNMVSMPTPDVWCYEVRNGNDVIVHVRGVNTKITNGDDPSTYPFDPDDNGSVWSYGGVRFTFGAMGTGGYLYGANPIPSGTIGLGSGGSANFSKMGMTPGNKNYYLSKLGRLELLGIPQIFYEPIYCNSNRSKMVDGIFKSDPTKTAFESLPTAMAYSSAVTGTSLEGIYDSTSVSSDTVANLNQAVVYQDQVDHPAIFSGSDFMCCARLGSEVTDEGKCCSNFAKENEEGNLSCAIPSKTDLNVYFNRFVSNEAIGEDLPEGGLKDEDFIPLTGEPKLNADVIVKLTALGDKFCEGGQGTVRRGGAFGDYYGEPNTGILGSDEEKSRRFSIVDSSADQDEDNGTFFGFVDFTVGYRWDTHLYCE